MPINSFLYPGAKVTTGYDVANSLRFNSGSSDYLNRTPSGAGTQTKATISVWFKRSNLSSNQAIFSTGSNNVVIKFTTADKIAIYDFNGSSMDLELNPSMVFRDTSAWYHIVVSLDSTQSTSSDRAKLYINGSLISDFDSTTYPSQNYNFKVNGTLEHFIGRLSGLSQYFNGYMAEFVNIDGQQLDPTSFGEFDSDSPTIWKPKDVSGLTFGTNGFYLDFEDSSALGNDVSGNNNDFTVNNLTAIDQSTDTCTLNMATYNNLNVPTSNAPTFSEGNLKTVTNGSDGNFGGTSTIGVSQGKWYAEFKFISTSGGMQVGITGDPSEDARLNNYTGENSLGYSVFSGNGNKFNNGSQSSFGVTWGANDIIGVALDLDNHKIYFHKNGTYMNSGDPTSGATGTGSAFNLTTGYDYFFSVSDGSSGDSSTIDANFGSPPYTISSGNADGDGYGNFEYAVPNGYFSLNSKNLAEYG